jgi:cytochrome c-type biogenesis protein CcmE
MALTRRQRRLALVLGGVTVLAVAMTLILTALSQNIVFFLSPSDALARTAAAEGESFRLGGLVTPGSIRKESATRTVFSVTDGASTVTVSTDEPLPDLFSEGRGVVVQGRLNPDKTFVADQVLAKHDENYMPAEVAEALKKSGHWHDEAGQQAAP